jgi:hypothetical protein
MELETSEPFEVQAPLVGRSFSVAVQSDDEEVIAKIQESLTSRRFPSSRTSCGRLLGEGAGSFSSLKRFPLWTRRFCRSSVIPGFGTE